MPKGKYWTEDELKWLTDNYNILGCERCAEILDRSYKAVYHKASRICVKKNGKDRPFRILIKDGYLLVSGYNSEVFIHRAIAENKIGRRIKPNEVVHHIDGNKFNNDPNNLKVITRVDHTKIEHKHNIDAKGRFIG